MGTNTSLTSDVVRQRLDELFASSPPTEAEARDDLEVTGPVDESEPPVGESDPSWLVRLREFSERASSSDVRASTPKANAEPVKPITVVKRAAEFSREHLATVVVVALVAICWTGYSLIQARTTPVADAAVTQEPRAQASALPTNATGQLVVHVIGAVAHPGVVRLAPGARIIDAITAAGGLTAQARLGEFNLAQLVTDGTQIKVGTRARPGGWVRSMSGSSNGGLVAPPGPAGAADSAKVSLNSGTAAQFDTLPGVGPVTAAKIIAWRTQHGKFSAITELQEVDGIGPKTYSELASRVRL